jgi:serine/threonine protein kinase
MHENTRTQSKHFIVKIKKTFHLITALAFFLQQLVPYSSAFAMENDEIKEPSSSIASLNTPSKRFTEHPTFVGTLLNKTYEIWTELSQREADHLRLLTAKEVPVVIASEKIVFSLGKGNFGVTYAGRGTETRAIFAIKVVLGQEDVKVSLNEGDIVHFLGEDSHIMPLIDYMYYKSYETEPPRLFQVMPLAYINGDGFKEMLTRSQKAQREKIVVDSFYQMMLGLEYIHEKGVVHLDIKADNTLYMKDGTLRIADFGRAKILGANDQITDPHNGLGAKKKHSPEIIALFRKRLGGTWETVNSFSGKGADVWAAGLYIWELLEDNTDNLFSTKPIPQSEVEWAGNYSYAYFEAALKKIEELNEKYSVPLLTLLRQVLTVDPETRIKPPQIIENLSSSAMSPDDRRTAFEELIQVYKNPSSAGGELPSDDQLLPKSDGFKTPYPDKSVPPNETEELERIKEDLRRQEQLLAQREADLKKQLAAEEEEQKQRQAQLLAQREADLQRKEAAEEAQRRRAIPQIALGHEDVYERFLKGRLIYKPNKENDEGKIELRIADLGNPLEGEFDLSGCGDTGKYLSINTGYRKGKRPENANKTEIWFAPRFLIEKNLSGSASHFKDIMGSWDASTAPVGTFFTWGGWDDLNDYDYATKLTWEAYNDPENNLRKIDNSLDCFPHFGSHWPQPRGSRFIILRYLFHF